MDVETAESMWAAAAARAALTDESDAELDLARLFERDERAASRAASADSPAAALDLPRRRIALESCLPPSSARGGGGINAR